mmetsp:Transcript_17820/g.35964  ORF Transcript_17820/g.35964 Transcript_17820/m.35964 type:complete len:773 (+) Transcript_17820:84-2402(+)
MMHGDIFSGIFGIWYLVFGMYPTDDSSDLRRYNPLDPCTAITTNNPMESIRTDKNMSNVQGFGFLKLTWRFYATQGFLVVLRLAARLLYTGYCVESSMEELVDSTIFLTFEEDSPFCDLVGYCMSACFAIIILCAILDVWVTLKNLSRMDYMETRFRQIVFRFMFFDLVLSMVIYLLLYLNFFMSFTASHNPDIHWFTLASPGPLLLLRPMLIVTAFLVLFIAFLPPAEKRILCFDLVDDDPFDVPWGDVALALAASTDVYWDAPGDTVSSGSKPISWTRKAYRLLGMVHRKETDGHCLIAEVTPEAGRLRMHGWNMRPGDLIISFRGTDSFRNVKTDLQFSRTPLPYDLVFPRYHLHVPGSHKTRANTHKSRGLSLGEYKKPERKARSRPTFNKMMTWAAPRNKTKHASSWGAAYGLGPGARSFLDMFSSPLIEEKNDDPEDGKHSGIKEETEDIDMQEIKGTLGDDDSKDDHGSIDKPTNTNEPEPARWVKDDHQQTAAEKTAEIFQRWILRERVHSGFLALYMDIRAPLMKMLDPILAPSSGPWDDSPPSRRRNAAWRPPHAAQGSQGSKPGTLESKAPPMAPRGATADGHLQRPHNDEYTVDDLRTGSLRKPMFFQAPSSVSKTSFLGSQMGGDEPASTTASLDGTLPRPRRSKVSIEQKQPAGERKESRGRRGAPAEDTEQPRQIMVTGHSLGAALATIAALDLHTRYTRAYVIRLVNLASPRVGDHSFAKVFNARIPNAVRVNTERDLIPGLPKFFCMFKHVGHEV